LFNSNYSKYYFLINNKNYVCFNKKEIFEGNIHFSLAAFRMAHVHVTEDLARASGGRQRSRGTKYMYTYESSHLDGDGQDTKPAPLNLNGVLIGPQPPPANGYHHHRPPKSSQNGGKKLEK
jgi:hypothetical protein